MVRIRGSADKLTESQDLQLLGSGYLDEQTALREGRRWISAVQAGFAESGIGADFGDRSQSGGIGAAAKAQIKDQFGVELMAEPHRLIAYPCAEKPMFLSSTASGYSGRPASCVRDSIALAEQQSADLDEKLTPVYHLYSASFFEANPDSRLMILMMALETLLEEERHEQAVQDHIDALIADTKASQLDPATVASLCSALSGLKRKSISHGGRELAAKLAGRQYDGRGTVEFFTEAYRMRSRLAHGAFPRPEPTDVQRFAGALRTFVGDLIRTLSTERAHPGSVEHPPSP